MDKIISSGLFLLNKDNKVLICHPTNHKATSWSIPKGKVDEGESLISAAIRETYEESNILIPIYSKFIELPIVEYKHKRKTLCSFLVLESQNPTIIFNNFDLKCNSNVPIEKGGYPEMDDYKWVELDEAKTMLHETQAVSIDEIKKIIEKIKNMVLS
jgi:8-oxo-dGTP pyrophosphatase MutT (NUDIX family)